MDSVNEQFHVKVTFLPFFKVRHKKDMWGLGKKKSPK